MMIYPLGVGGAFTERYFHNNYVIEQNGKRLLVDAGSTLRYSLKSLGFSANDLHYMVISHFHFDHVGGLEELLMQRYWLKDKPQEKLQLLIHENQLESFKKLLTPSLHNQSLTIDDYVQFVIIFDHEPVPVGPFAIQFIDTCNLHVSEMQSYAFKVFNQESKRNILFSADIKDLQNSNLLHYVDDKTELILQDTSFKSSMVHATIQEVLEYYPQELHSKIFAMHYEDNTETDIPFDIKMVQQGVPFKIE